jgi:CheY-like chemotaxis protein
MAAIATPTFLRNRTRILIASTDASLRQRVKKDPLYAESDSEEAVGGAHALAKLLQFPCDSVLLDRNLPDLDASEVAEQIRKQFPRIEVELFDARFASMNPQGVENQQGLELRNDESEIERARRLQSRGRAFPPSPAGSWPARHRVLFPAHCPARCRE